jgi:hypothetical protein
VHQRFQRGQGRLLYPLLCVIAVIAVIVIVLLVTGWITLCPEPTPGRLLSSLNIRAGPKSRDSGRGSRRVVRRPPLGVGNEHVVDGRD